MDTLSMDLVEAHEFLAEDLPRLSVERRAHERKSIRMRARVTVPGKAVLPGLTMDFSGAGASLTVPFALAEHQNCHVDLELAACGVSGAIHIAAQVRYCVELAPDRFRVGVRFGDMDPQSAALIEAILSAAPQ